MNFKINPTHLVTNIISFGITAISGLALNILIVRFYNSDILGLFNQILAVYFILSQITTFGIHYSIISNIPTSEHKEKIFTSGMVSVLITSISFSIFFYYLMTLCFQILDFPDLISAMPYISFSLIFFSLNKVMISTLNGQGRFNLFAIANSLRLLLMLVGIISLYLANFSYSSIPLIIVGAELSIFLFLVICHRSFFKAIHFKDILKLSLKHISFGRYALLSGLIIDINTKVDIIILSLFVDRASVGIYSFAAMLGEGFYLLISVFKNLNSPNISIQISNKNLQTQVTNKHTHLIILFFYILAILSTGLFEYFALIVTNDPVLSMKGTWIYGIYVFCLAISVRFLLFDNILILLKKPKIDSIIKTASLLTNTMFCFILIPNFGIYGAVIALGTSILVNAFSIGYIIRKKQMI